MKAYLELNQRVLDEGKWVHNARTGNHCLTVIDASFTYDCSTHLLPVLTTKKMVATCVSAMAEMLGYIRGYDNASQFRALGTKTWDENANNNKAWLANPHRKGVDDMGRVYGVQGRRWQSPDGSVIDQLKKIVDDLSRGVDDRREILTYWNPGEMNLGCLAACMHTHTFSVLDGELFLTSYQRSDDLPLGHAFNQIQVAWFLMVMAQITGLKPGKAFHKIVNAHMYENQVAIMRDVQLKRKPFKQTARLEINPNIKTLEDLETWVTMDDFKVVGYDAYYPAIVYPFSV